MKNLKNYLKDGANYQARATLMFLQRNANIEENWNVKIPKDCEEITETKYDELFINKYTN